MIEFISGSVFRFFWLPLFTVLLTMLIKACSKKESMRFLDKEDFAIGPNLITTSIFILVSKISIVALNIKLQPELLNAGTEIIMRLVVYLVIMLFGLIALMTIVRRFGWERDIITGQNRLKTGAGIVFPDIMGLLYLIMAFTMNIEIPQS